MAGASGAVDVVCDPDQFWAAIAISNGGGVVCRAALDGDTVWGTAYVGFDGADDFRDFSDPTVQRYDHLVDPQVGDDALHAGRWPCLLGTDKRADIPYTCDLIDKANPPCDDTPLWEAVRRFTNRSWDLCRPTSDAIGALATLVLDSEGKVVENTLYPDDSVTKQTWLDSIAKGRWPCLAGQTIPYICEHFGV